jgi:DNA-binding NtrC family response regulator
MKHQTKTKDKAVASGEAKARKALVLIAVKDGPYGSTLGRYLETDGYEVELCADARGVFRLASRKPFDIIVLDLELSDESGLELVTYIRRQLPEAKTILLFDVNRLERALEGMRRGAFFYLPRNCQPSDVALAAGKALRALDTDTQLRRIEQDMLGEMVGGTPAMARVVELVSKVAPTDSTVLLLGESGTGKEVLAQAIHQLSPRRDMPFIAINCAALPDTLLESEMFGHMRGAFTGADSDKTGLFEEADSGTIFLDEIGDMALVTQAKLLRVLQNGEIRPVGSAVPRRVDVRVIAATNRDLEKAVLENRFREDLYFRLNVIQINIPPLRERMDALPKLVRFFVERYGTKFGKRIDEIEETAGGLLRNYPYPGNIRELESIIAHAVIMSEDGVVRVRDLPEHVQRGDGPRLALPNYAADNIPTIEEMEKDLIRTALDRLEGNQTETAKRLGISRSTLWRKMKEYGISQ